MHRGFILQPTYRVRDGRAVVQLFGRLEDGDAFLVEDDRFKPYFFVPREDASILAGEAGVDVVTSGLQDLGGAEVLRVVVSLPGAVPPLRERVIRAGGRALEADVRFPYRYLIDHGIRAGVAIDGEDERVQPGFVRFRNPDLRPVDLHPKLRTLSLDLETSPDASEIYSAALVSRDVEEVHLVCEGAVPGAVCHADERALLASAPSDRY